MKPLKFIQRTHVVQYGKFSSGLACLVSIAKYYEGEIRHGDLTFLSGTSPLGTTVLGLYQAANKVGFNAEGYKCTIEDLKNISDPVVLDVTSDNALRSFIVCYGYDGQFLVGDPQWGIVQYSVEELNAIWKSKTLLALTPNDHFLKAKSQVRRKLKWLKEIMKDDRHLLSIVVVVDFIVASLSLAPAVAMQNLTVNFFPSPNIAKTLQCFALLGIAMMIRLGFNYVKEILVSLQSKEFSSRLTEISQGRIFFQHKSFFEGITSGKLLSVAHDAERIQQVISYLLRNVLAHFLIILLFVAFLFSYSVALASTTSLVVFAYGLLIWRFNDNMIFRLQTDIAALQSKAENNHVNNHRLISVIKLFNKEGYFSNITKDIRTLLREKTFSLEIAVNKNSVKQNCVGIVLGICTLIIITYLYMNHGLNIGEILVSSIVIGYIADSARKLVMCGFQVREGKNVLDRIFEFIYLTPEDGATETANESTRSDGDFNLFVKNISFRYTGNRPLFKNISFSVKRGELTAIYGEASSGKSSILKILQRFYDHETGEIIYNEKDWRAIDTYSWRQKIAVVPQDIKLLNNTVIENICFENLFEEAPKVIDFCKQYHFDKYFDSLPQGYLTLVGEDGINLSSGQVKLIALARALYKQPGLLLLDEITNSMDQKMETFTLSLLNTIKEKTAVLLVTNRPKLASKCDYIYVLDKGEMILHGEHEQLLQFKNTYSECFNVNVVVTTV